MLTIHSLPSGLRYIRIRKEFSFGTSVGVKYSKPTFLFGPFPLGSIDDVSPELISQIDGFITESPKNEFGDRSCNHRNVIGDVKFAPFQAGSGSVVDNLFVHKWIKTSPTASTDYTHILSAEETFLFRTPNAPEFGDGKVIVLAKNYGEGRFICGTAAWNTGGTFSASLTRYRIRSLDFKTRSQNFSLSGMTEDTLRDLPWSEITTGLYAATGVIPLSINISVEEIERTLLGIHQRAYEDGFLPAIIPCKDGVYGDLAQECIDQTRSVDTNTLSFVSELREIAKLLPELPIGQKALNPKTWASAYLALQYGLKLTAMDIRSLGGAIIEARAQSQFYKDAHQILYASSHDGGLLSGMAYNDTYHYKVIVEPLDGPGMEAVRLLDQWGFYPTPARLWDMIPFSFVVDWFVKVGNFLDSVDLDLISKYYRVLEVCWSRKVELDYPVSKLFPQHFASGTISLVWYVRSLSKELHPLQFRIEKAGEFRNWAEGLALIIVNKK